jgi:Bacterial regulatory protein, Fis family
MLRFRLLQIVDVGPGANKPHEVSPAITYRNRAVQMPVVFPVGAVVKESLEHPSLPRLYAVPENLPDTIFVVRMQGREERRQIASCFVPGGKRRDAGLGALHFDLRERTTDGATQSPESPRPPFTRRQFVELERQSIEEALQKSGGKIYGPGGAAELLGMRPTTLSSKIGALGIKRH